MYEDWATAERERLLAGTRAAQRTAELLFDLGQLDECIAVSEQVYQGPLLGGSLPHAHQVRSSAEPPRGPAPTSAARQPKSEMGIAPSRSQGCAGAVNQAGLVRGGLPPRRQLPATPPLDVRAECRLALQGYP